MSTSHDETIEQPPTQQPEHHESDGVEQSTSTNDVAGVEEETKQTDERAQTEEAETTAEQKDVPQIEVETEKTANADSEDEVDAIAGDGTATPAEQADEATDSEPKASTDADKRLAAQSTGTKESDAAIPPGIASSLARPPTPSSRTSTPPLNSSASGAKKFSSVNVNKKFLSKTVTPAAGSPAAGAKLGLSSTSPVPISTTSRLLSTKLTTVPSKTSQSPLPASSATSTPSSSPWAKPALIEPESSIKAPAPTKARVLSSIQPVSMGSGQGIAVAKAAWRPVTQEGKRGVGLSRDFPTAKEVADGKRDAAAIAQAKAAHNQAIMQELNAFTQLNPNARHWEDDDDDDEVIDFGDGIVYPHHDHPPARPVNEAPVTKSERFVEDFDRSWPRQRPAQSEEATAGSGLPRRPENDRDRVLFNANSNRLEPPSGRPQPPSQPQPTRLMSRPDPSRPTTLDRSLPPHLQGGEGGRALPPHMLHAPAPAAQPAPSSRPLAQPARPPPQASSSVRQPWGAQRDDTRPLPPHLQPSTSSDRNEPPAHSAAQPAHAPSHAQPANNQRRSFSQLQRPPPPQQTGSVSPHAPAAVPAPPSAAPAGGLPPKVDDQTAEMHSAAEKARLRRLAEEQEREAAAERARRKAKELEERLGLKNAAAAAAPPAPTSSAAVPAAAAPTPVAPTSSAPTAPRAGFTLAQRPQQSAQPSAERAGSSGLPARPAETRPVGREAEGSWRTRAEQPPVEAKPEVSSILPRVAPGRGEASSVKGPHASAPAQQARTSSHVAPAPFRDLPPHAMPAVIAQPPAVPAAQQDVPADIADALLPAAERPQKREQTFDNMLARIQAAMKEARTTPTAIEEIEAIVAEVVPPAEVVPAVKAVQQAARPPAPRVVVPEPNVTQTDLPKSPPPAWRTYNVRIPKSEQAARPALPLPRIRAFENYRPVNPKGWLMSFDPPIEGLSLTNLSRSEHFLPVGKTKRFGKTVDVSPMVSISPRTLEPYVKKDKKKADAEKETGASQAATSVQVGNGGAGVAEALLGGETVVSAPGEALRRSQATQEAQSAYQPQPVKSQNTSPVASRTFPRAAAPPTTKGPAASTAQQPAQGVQSNRWSSDKLDAIAQPIPKPPSSVQALEAARKPKSPVKQSLAAKAEKDGLFSGDGVGIRNPDQRERALSDAKPGQGVRFMVSSELEGDSLLDEVNKISLEMVGEGVDGRERPEGKSGVDSPGTPAKASNSARAGTSPTSASTWSNGPVRSTPHGSQHDLMKSMWEQTPAGGSTKEASARADQYISPLVPSTSNTDIATPMYPSLNAPSSTDTSTQSQALSAGMKMSYGSQQAFSPPGGAQQQQQQQQQPYARSPQYPGTSGTYSPDPHSMYGRTTPGSVNGMAHGAQAYGMHQQHSQQQIPQAVWSPSAFGAGYGYTNKSTPPVGDKASAGMAFASASPVGGADYRYGAQQGQGQAAAGGGGYGYGHGHGHQHQHQGHQAYGAGGYGRQPVTSPVNHGYGYYGSGASGGQSGRGGRFGANATAGAAAGGGAAGAAAAAAIAAGAGAGAGAVNGEHGYGYGALEGGYYGGVGGGGHGVAAAGHQYGYAQGGHGAIGSQQQQQLLLQQQQQHLQAAQARAGALSAQQRKMWG